MRLFFTILFGLVLTAFATLPKPKITKCENGSTVYSWDDGKKLEKTAGGDSIFTNIDGKVTVTKGATTTSVPAPSAMSTNKTTPETSALPASQETPTTMTTSTVAPAATLPPAATLTPPSESVQVQATETARTHPTAEITTLPLVADISVGAIPPTTPSVTLPVTPPASITAPAVPSIPADNSKQLQEVLHKLETTIATPLRGRIAGHAIQALTRGELINPMQSSAA